MTRLVRFNVVGAAGFAVQLAVLAALERGGWPVLPATLVAVEAALLHNFVWHDRWTWAGCQSGTRVRRLARFHVTNGAISLLGNAVITAALHAAGTPLVGANAIAVVACAAANFAAAEFLIWPAHDPERASHGSPRRLLC
jgi:putative flippase GtrA